MQHPTACHNQTLSRYCYQGTNLRGEPKNGEIDATNRHTAKALLKRQGILVYRIRKKNRSLFERNKQITAADIAVISRQLATLLNAGIPLVQSLELITKSAANTRLRALLDNISVSVQTGNPLADTLRQYPHYFDELYCNLVACGEQSGTLDNTLEKIASYKEKTEKLKSKIKKALYYPIAVLSAAVLVTFALLTFAVPQLVTFFNSFDAELPAFTLFVLRFSELAQQYWWVLLSLLSIMGFLTMKLYRKSSKFRIVIAALLLNLPIIGTIVQKAAVARYAQTLATTFAAGVPLIAALASSAGATGNEIYKNAILDVRSAVCTGNPISSSMQQTQCFPEMVVQMVAIGEESGQLERMLTKVATIYEQEIDAAVEGLTSLLEPVIMLTLGILIGGVIIAMYLPIIQLGNIVG